MLRALLLALALAGAGAAAPAAVAAQQKLRIVATSADLKSLAESVGGERVEVESLAAPDQDPHTLEIKPAQLVRARSAALVIRVGLDHEPWFAKLQLPRGAAVLDASKNVRLVQTETPRLRTTRAAHVHAYGNTHYWLDPENAIAIVAAIREALATLSPRDAQLFEANRRAFVETLSARTAQWRAAAAPFRGSKIVVMHDSWSYFAQFLGLDVVAAAEPQPGVPPAPAELAELFKRMRATGVKVIVAEPHSPASLVRQIAAQTGAQPITLSASGHDYLRMMDANVSTLAAALNAGGARPAAGRSR